MRDVVDRHPKFDKNPEIVAKIVRRITDEDGVKKLVLETLYNLWFAPTDSDDAFNARISLMVDSISEIIKLGFIEYMKQAISAILKEYADKPQLENVCRQIVDALVDNVLQLDQEIANVEMLDTVGGSLGGVNEDEELNAVANSKRIVQQRLIASLTALSVFSNVNPSLLIRHAEILIPYLALKPTNTTESQVLVAVNI